VHERRRTDPQRPARGIVGAGYTFDLRERELETLLEARSAPTATVMRLRSWMRPAAAETAISKTFLAMSTLMVTLLMRWAPFVTGTLMRGPCMRSIGLGPGPAPLTFVGG